MRLNLDKMNLPLSSLINLLNEIYVNGFFDRGFLPQLGKGYTGQEALVLHRYRSGKPMMSIEVQERLAQEIAREEYDEFKFKKDFEKLSGESRPIYLLIERDTGENALGFEWDRLAFYQPDQPSFGNYIKRIFEELKKDTTSSINIPAQTSLSDYHPRKKFPEDRSKPLGIDYGKQPLDDARQDRY